MSGISGNGRVYYTLAGSSSTNSLDLSFGDPSWLTWSVLGGTTMIEWDFIAQSKIVAPFRKFISQSKIVDTFQDFINT